MWNGSTFAARFAREVHRRKRKKSVNRAYCESAGRIVWHDLRAAAEVESSAATWTAA